MRSVRLYIIQLKKLFTKRAKICYLIFAENTLILSSTEIVAHNFFINWVMWWYLCGVVWKKKITVVFLLVLLFLFFIAAKCCKRPKMFKITSFWNLQNFYFHNFKQFLETLLHHKTVRFFDMFHKDKTKIISHLLKTHMYIFNLEKLRSGFENNQQKFQSFLKE